MKYKCIKNLTLQSYDEDIFEENDKFIVEKNSIWEQTENNYLGADIHLENNNGNWIEITKDKFEECFVVEYEVKNDKL